MIPFDTPFTISSYVISTTFQQVALLGEWNSKLGDKIDWHESIFSLVSYWTWPDMNERMVFMTAMPHCYNFWVTVSVFRCEITVPCCGTKRKLALWELNFATLNGNKVCLHWKHLNREHMTFLYILVTWEWRLQVNKCIKNFRYTKTLILCNVWRVFILKSRKKSTKTTKSECPYSVQRLSKFSSSPHSSYFLVFSLF